MDIKNHVLACTCCRGEVQFSINLALAPGRLLLLDAKCGRFHSVRKERGTNNEGPVA
jgi:hypothetical protein